MSDIITGEDALRALREIVAERPDYLYLKDHDTCKYTGAGDADSSEARDAPSCLVGHVYARLVPDFFAQLVDVEDHGGGGAVGHIYANGSIGDGLIDEPIDEDAAHILREAQSAQDGGDTWEDALAFAEHTASVRGVTID